MKILTKNCIVCGKEYAKPYYTGLPEWNRRKYCSLNCINVGRIAWNKGKPKVIGAGRDFVKGHYTWNKDLKGIHLSPQSEFKKGHTPWHAGTKGIKKQRPWTLEERQAISLRQRGAKSHLWRGGTSKLSHLIRVNAKYKQWRTTIFKRDNYTCQHCNKRGGKLNVDHIKPFASLLKDNKIKSLKAALLWEQLWDLNNGRTLCLPCHIRTKTYARNHRYQNLTFQV